MSHASLLGSPSYVGGFVAEIAAPWVVCLKIPNRGRVMVDDRRMISIKVGNIHISDMRLKH